MINGIINVYKEKAFTSHDVVAKLRGILKQKKIGHTGTLDPDATGVLPVCLGNGTKLCDMITDKSKEYQVTFQLGYTTDTQDISGTILSKRAVICDKEQVREAIMSFIGDYNQIPPMYSAIKVNGKRLYELAREGKEIERKARPITINQIEIMEIDLPNIVMKVACSKGTYIRTLCFDIGEQLCCGATMTELTRTRVGEFLLEDAITLNQIEALRDSDTILDYVVKVDSVFKHLKKGSVLVAFRKFIDNGNPLLLTQIIMDNRAESRIEKESGIQKESEIEKETDLIDKERIRIYNDERIFCGLYEYSQERGYLMPVKMFSSI